MRNQIICGDCLEVLPTLPNARMIFMDPPDNLGLKYRDYKDKQPFKNYFIWLKRRIYTAMNHHPDVIWISFYYRYIVDVFKCMYGDNEHDWRLFVWRFTFGQHRQTDCGNGYRPIVRISKWNIKWNTNAIRVPSKRTLLGDKRADKRGRVPDDVWEFPRVCGTFKEKRKWAITQHPEALIERMIKMSCQKGDLVIDMFAHSGTVNRVCKRLKMDCIGIDISKFYCRKIAKETGAKFLKFS